MFRKHPGGTGQCFVLRTAPPGRATCEDIRPHVVRKLSLHPCDDCAHLVEMSKIRCGIHRAHVVLPGHRVAIAGQHVQTELFVEMSGRRRRCGQCGQHRVVVGIELVGALAAQAAPDRPRRRVRRGVALDAAFAEFEELGEDDSHRKPQHDDD